VQAVREKSDPIEGLKEDMLAAGITEEAMKVIDQDIRKVVAEAADFAESAPEPDITELYTDVLVEQY
jgi:pyruvate dehydrogenase E1 component alpha subunit